MRVPSDGRYRIGTAGWGIPKPHADAFPAAASHLARYAQVFSAVEINSSFYRPHQPQTYARWAASVPPGFRFAVKLWREITHVRRIVAATEPLERFLQDIAHLGDRLGPVLVQLPPSLRFVEGEATAFFDALRLRFDGNVVLEPRHASWFDDTVDGLLVRCRIARVAADPAPVPQAAQPGGWTGIAYRRLHGSPRIYYSPYGTQAVATTGRDMREAAPAPGESWCIFDNTALGEATADALRLHHLLQAAE